MKAKGVSVGHPIANKRVELDEAPSPHLGPRSRGHLRPPASPPQRGSQMRTVVRTLLLQPVLYRVMVPVRGITEGEHKAAMFPRGTLLERLPQDESTRVPVRCYGRDYSVLEEDLTQKCERVVRRQPASAPDPVFVRA